MSSVVRFLLSFAIILIYVASFASQERASGVRGVVVNGSLAELRNKHRVWLIVRRSNVLDASGAEKSVLSEAFREGNLRQSFPRSYNMIARKLNKYMKEHHSLTAARSLSEAEFIIFFNVLEIRRPLGMPYAYGEMFVIINESSNPRILWKSKSSGMFVDDAINELISELKATRGER